VNIEVKAKKMVEKKKTSFNFQRYQFIFSLLLLFVAVGLSIYLQHSKPKQSCEAELKYWPMVVHEWNPNDNLRSIKRVFDRLGYQMVNGSEEDSWDILWSLEFPYDNFPEKLKNLKPHQRINHFPGMIIYLFTAL
jgi:hypothetical protein